MSHNCKRTWQHNIFYFNHKDFWISLKALVFHIQACHPRLESFWALVSQICRCYNQSKLLWSVQHWGNHQQVDETLFGPVFQKHWTVSSWKLNTQSTRKWWMKDLCKFFLKIVNKSLLSLRFAHYCRHLFLKVANYMRMNFSRSSTFHKFVDLHHF